MFTRKIYILFGVLLLIYANTFSQELNLTGKILDAENYQPLPFANLIIEKTNYSSTTNDKGVFYFHINKHVDFPLYIQVSYIGYEKQKIEISKPDSSIIIHLQPKSFALNEISVFAKQIFMASKEGISSNTLSSGQIHNLSGLTKDPFRSIQLLPGVSNNNETSAKYNVRGGNYDENLVLINGIEIYNPFHIKEAPMASVGVFNIDMVKNISFSAGGFNAEYGNALSSLLDINYESGNSAGFEGKFDLNFLDMSLLTKGPIGGKAAYNIGLRRSNLEYLLRAGHVKPETHMTYYDFQTQFDFQFNTDNKIRFNVIYAGDDYNQKPDVEIFTGNSYKVINGITDIANLVRYRKHPFVATYRNLLVSFISENKLTNNLSSKISISSYHELEDENTSYDDENNYTFSKNSQFWEKLTEVGNLQQQLKTTTLSYKHDFLFNVFQGFSFKSGFNYKRISHDYNSADRMVYTQYNNIKEYPEVFSQVLVSPEKYNDTLLINLKTYRLEGYLQTAFQVFNNININVGMRFDYFDLNKQTKYSPRINFLYTGPFGINLRAAWGVFYQPPTFIQFRNFSPSSDNTGYQKAIHYILGLDKNISDHLTFSTEFYYKKYDDFIPAIKALNGRISYGNKLNNAIGYATGIDVQLMLNFDRFYFWASYGHLIAREKLINSDEGYYPRFTDQTHTLSAVLGVDLGNRWEITIKGFYGSGYAYTPSELIWDSSINAFKWTKGENNSAHYPPYERVDLTVSKSFNLFSNPLEIYFDIMNILNKKNILAFEYSFDSTGNSLIKENKLFTVVPMIGLKYNF